MSQAEIDRRSAADEREHAAWNAEPCARCGHSRIMHLAGGEPVPCFCDCDGFASPPVR